MKQLEPLDNLLLFVAELVEVISKSDVIEKDSIYRQANDALVSAMQTIEWLNRVLEATQHTEDFIKQELGKALKYPWYKDDQFTFPGATEENGVIVLDHPEDMVTMAVTRIGALEQRIAELEQEKLNMAVNLSGGH